MDKLATKNPGIEKQELTNALWKNDTPALMSSSLTLLLLLWTSYSTDPTSRHRVDTLELVKNID
jgi:hypothetical protein